MYDFAAGCGITYGGTFTYNGGKNMKAVITVIGKDTVGILAGVSGECAKNGANVVEVTQSVMQDMFAMIMMVDITNCTVPFKELSE